MQDYFLAGRSFFGGIANMDPMQMEPNTMEKRMLRRASAAQRPINGSLELLPLCNMNCDMCYVRMSREEMEEVGRLRTMEEWTKTAQFKSH